MSLEWDSFGKDTRRGIRIIKFLLLPTFSSQLSFVLGNSSYFLSKQHVPKCADLVAAGQGCLISGAVSCRSGGSCGCSGMLASRISRNTQ